MSDDRNPIYEGAGSEAVADVCIEDNLEEVRDRARQLKSERLIKIFVGEATEPYLVQQALLERTSPYFKKAIKNEHLGGAHNIGVLRFPEDDKQVWELLLCWMLDGEMPVRLYHNENSQSCHGMKLLMVQCWAAGDRYLLPHFRDSAMVYLLYWTDVARLKLHYKEEPSIWIVIRLGFEVSGPESSLRKMLARRAIELIYTQEGLVMDESLIGGLAKLGCLDGVPGAMTDLFLARDEIQNTSLRLGASKLKEAIDSAIYFEAILPRGYSPYEASDSAKIQALLDKLLLALVFE